MQKKKILNASSYHLNYTWLCCCKLVSSFLWSFQLLLTAVVMNSVGKDHKMRSVNHKMTWKPHGRTAIMNWNSVPWLVKRSFSKIPEKKIVVDGKLVNLEFVLFCLFIYTEVMSEAYFLRMIRNLRFLSAELHYGRMLQNCSIYLYNNSIFINFK